METNLSFIFIKGKLFVRNYQASPFSKMDILCISCEKHYNKKLLQHPHLLVSRKISLKNIFFFYFLKESKLFSVNINIFCL